MVWEVDRQNGMGNFEIMPDRCERLCTLHGVSVATVQQPCQLWCASETDQ